VRFLAIILLSLFFFSCNKEEKVPDYVWEEERFVEVLTQFQMAEAVVRLGYHRKPDSMYLNDSVYNAAFREVNTSRAAFDSNYNYYLEHPEMLEKAYEKVITNLSTKSAELEKDKNRKQKQDSTQVHSDSLQ
jgi:hypothetical protein